jgi:hypothetical protein
MSPGPYELTELLDPDEHMIASGALRDLGVAARDGVGDLPVLGQGTPHTVRYAQLRPPVGL